MLGGCVPGPRVTGAPGINISDDLIFVAYGPFTYAMNTNTKAVEWHFPDEANSRIVFYTEPLVVGDAVYVGDLANNFYKIDIETGNEVWTFSEAKGFFIGKAAEENGVVFAPSNDGFVYSLDADGNELWRFETGHYVWAQPQIGGNTIYIGSADHFIYAVSKTEGELIWSFEMQGAILSSPVISEDGQTLYAASIGKEMVALDVAAASDEDRVKWTFNADGEMEAVWGQSILVDGILYFADSSGKIFALNGETGQSVWDSPITFSGTIIGGLTQLEDGFVFASEEGDIQAYDFDGGLIWQRSISGEIFQAPVVNGDYLVVGALEADELVHVFDLAGNPVWSETPEK